MRLPLGPGGLLRRMTTVDLPSFLLGGGAGAAVAGMVAAFGIPDPHALVSLTVTPEAAAAAGIAAAALAVALRRPRAHSTPLPTWRHSSPTHARTGTPTAPTVPDADWEWMGLIQPVSGFKGEGYRLLRAHLAEQSLFEQVRLQTGEMASALIDALLAIASGKVTCSALDDLAAIAFETNAARARDMLQWFVRDLERAVPDLPDRRGSLGERHAFTTTRFVGALCDARAVDVVPVADFAWLAREHWSLWLAATCADAGTVYAECAGILCHHRAEASAGRAIAQPVTIQAARTLAGFGDDDGEDSALEAAA